MKTPPSSLKRAFSLIETVIAIGVLAVLLTGFIIVFAPAAAGIKKSISAQEADRLASTLMQELVTPKIDDKLKRGFNKAFDWIKGSGTSGTAVFVYQYRGSLSKSRSSDKTPEPMADTTGKLPGVDYALISMVRRKDDLRFIEDLEALEGGVYLVKCKQLVFKSGQLVEGTENTIVDPKTGTPIGGGGGGNNYPDAVLAFKADFYSLPGKRKGYFGKPFADNFTKFKNPVFTRNLAVRR